MLLEAAFGRPSRDEAQRGGAVVSRLRRLASGLLPRLGAAAALVALWQLAVSLQLEPSYALPGPGDVVAALAQQARQGSLGEAVFNSLRRGAAGYAVALAVGTLVGAAMTRSSLLRSSLGSLLAALQSLPSVTWVPIGILWFGLTNATIFFVVVLGAFPSIALGVMAAVDHIDPLMLRLAGALGAKGLDRYRHFILPAALPGYLAGLKQAWSFSWRSLMAAELIAISPQLGLGLGQLLDSGRQLADMSLVLGSMIAILAVGLAVDEIVFRPVERGVLRRRGLSA